jgi:glycosyltransferase involved in cell wall biosynthesis
VTACVGAVAEPLPAGMAVDALPRRLTLQDRYRRWRKERLRAQAGRKPRAQAGRKPRAPAQAVSTAAEAGPARFQSHVADILSFPDHARGWVLRGARLARSAIADFEPAAVVSTGPPHSVHMAAALALLGKNIPWIVDFRDPWTVVQHAYSPQAWSGAILRRIERWVVRRASLVLVTTPELRDALARHYPEARVVWLPNGADGDALPRWTGGGGRGLTLTHAGSIYFNRDPTAVAEAFARFLAWHPEAATDSVLRFVGTVSREFEPVLAQTIERLTLHGHVDLTGVVTRPQALELLASSSAALVLAQGQDGMVPAKIYEAAAMGIPTIVITEAGSATAREAGRIGAIVHEPADIEGMAATFRRIWAGEWLTPAVPARLDHAHLAQELEALLLERAMNGEAR